MGDRVRVPAFGQHRDRDDAADLLAELALLADGVHDLAQERRIVDRLGRADVACALNDIAAEPLDLIASHLAEIFVECLAGFKLRAVDQDRIGAGNAVAVVIVVAELLKAAILKRGRSILVLAMKARNVFVDEFRCGCVIADNNEDRRDTNSLLLPKVERLLVMAVKRFQRRQKHRQQR
jgi:hypothetical protein